MTKKLVLWTAVILWMGVIFFFSSQSSVQSDELSKGLVYRLIEIVDSLFDKPVFAIQDDYNMLRIVNALDHYMRKLAHFTIFAILGILVYNLINAYCVNCKKALLYSAVVCLLYAISDEVHQLFVPGRAGQIKDVFIDFSGSVIGIAVNVVFRKLYTGKEKVK